MEFYERVSRRAPACRLFPSRRRASGHAGGPRRRHPAPGSSASRKVIDDLETLLTENRIFKQRTVDIGIGSAPRTRSTGASPARCCAARASPGICARRSPTTSTTEMDFDIPDRQERRLLGPLSRAHGGDAPVAADHASRRSTKMPAGPVMVNDRKVAPPPRAEMKRSMEALIHHFKLYTEGYHVPAGETYTAVEAPKGEFGVYLVSDGTNRPYRCKIRAPGFAFLQATGFHGPRPHAGRRGGDHRLDGHRLRRDRPMSGQRPARRWRSPQSFAFTPENLGQGQGASSPSIRRAGRRARCCRCSIWRSARTTTGCRARRWTRWPRCSTWRRSASTRSRPSTPCSI